MCLGLRVCLKKLTFRFLDLFLLLFTLSISSILYVVINESHVIKVLVLFEQVNESMLNQTTSKIPISKDPCSRFELISFINSFKVLTCSTSPQIVTYIISICLHHRCYDLILVPVLTFLYCGFFSVLTSSLHYKKHKTTFLFNIVVLPWQFDHLYFLHDLSVPIEIKILTLISSSVLKIIFDHQ